MKQNAKKVYSLGRNKTVKKFLLLALTLCFLVVGVLAQVAQPARIVDTINVRTAPGTENAAITQLTVNTNVIVEARNRVGDWVLVRTEDGSVRGWVASRYAVWRDGIGLADLPISTETFNAPASVAVAPVNTTDGTSTQPVGTTPQVQAPTVLTEGLSPRSAELVNILSQVPIMPTLTPAMIEIYYNNLEGGRDPRNFVKIGDCNTENPAFMNVFSTGNYDLGEYSALQSTIDYYSGGYDSFSRRSMAGLTGNLASTVINPLYADTIKCPNQSLLSCEYGSQNAPVALMLFGMNDSYYVDVATFRYSVEQIALASLDQAVLPVFFTGPANPNNNPGFEKTMEFNLVLVQVGAQYNIPVVNFWLAAQSLGGAGATADAVHPTSNNNIPADFANGAHEQHAFALWNLLGLQVLDLFRQLN
jgi:uncharacterized protein YraI